MFYSSNEWSPLKKVLVGSTFGKWSLLFDISLKQFYSHINYMYLDAVDKNKNVFYKKQYIDELDEDVEELVSALKSLGIEVYRPIKYDKPLEITNGLWKSYILPPLNVRDLTTIIDDTILETAPMIRARYCENDMLKYLFNSHYRDGGNWLVMPRSTLADDTFDREYKGKYKEFFITQTLSEDDKTPIPDCDIPKNLEIMLDAAQMLRFDDDIIVNVANRNHALAIPWLKRNFPNKRWHVIRNATENHIDSYFAPLKEGVLLVRNECFIDMLPDFLKKWKMIVAPKPSMNNFPAYDLDDIVLAGDYIDMNVLSVDGDKIIVNSLNPDMIKLLEQNGFTPVPVRHRHRKIFGGGFHCFTLDLYREGH